MRPPRAKEKAVRTAIVVGNPKPKSRTFAATEIVAEKLTGQAPDVAIDVITLGQALLGWGDPEVSTALEDVRSCDVVIFASPTYKATYTGLLKLFLDQFPSDGLQGTVAIPLMLGAGPHHAMAPDFLLKPVLVELGAICPVRGLYLLDSNYEAPEVLDPWLAIARQQIRLRG
jgi:FMN reductase